MDRHAAGQRAVRGSAESGASGATVRLLTLCGLPTPLKTADEAAWFAIEPQLLFLTRCDNPRIRRRGRPASLVTRPRAVILVVSNFLANYQGVTARLRWLACVKCAARGPRWATVTTRGKAKYLGGVGTKVTGISRRKFKPNLQRVHVTTANGTNTGDEGLHAVHPQRRRHQDASAARRSSCPTPPAKA